MNTVYLLDDHEMILPGIRLVVESLEGFTVCGQATDGLTAVKEMIELEPDICVADLSVPMLNGFGVTRKLKEAKMKTKVILLTSFSDHTSIEEALKQDVAGYILKEDNSSELEQALKNVSKGYRYFTPKIMTQMMDGMLMNRKGEKPSEYRTRLGSLTGRECDVLSLVMNGLSGKEICTQLNISESTMKTHKMNLVRKMNVRNMKELVAVMHREELSAHHVP